MEGKAFGFFFAPDFVGWLEGGSRDCLGGESISARAATGPAFLRLKVGHAAQLFPASPGT